MKIVRRSTFFFCLFLIFIIVGNIYLIQLSTTKRHLELWTDEEGEEGVYANIRPISLLNIITPKNNIIECLFEIYFGHSSKRFGEDKGEFLCDVSVFFYDAHFNEISEYYFKGVTLQANTKLAGILWVEKSRYGKIHTVRYEVSEKQHYTSFNDRYYKNTENLLKIRGQDEESKRRMRGYKKRMRTYEKGMKQFDKIK